MKIKFLAAAILAFITLSAFTVNSNNPANNNQLIAIAKSALKSSCPGTEGNLQVSVRVVSACFAGGFITEVSFYKQPNCPPNQICPQYIINVGTVQLGCNNEVIGVTCGGAVTE